MSASTQTPTSDHRRGTGPTLVFLHYWGGSSRTWTPVVDRLPGRDVLTIDFRGWGRSRELPGPFTLQQFAADTTAVLADAGVHDHVLVGHSMGGKVAQLVAAAQPDGLRGLVLVAPAPARPPAAITPEYQQGLAHAYDTEASRAQARDEVLTARPLPEAWRRLVAEDSAASSDAARTQWPLHGIAEDISEATRRIAVPTLVIAGGLDRVEPVEVLREELLPHLADARFEVVPGVGHLLPLEAPQAVGGLLADFVAQLPGALPARDGQ